MKNLHTFEAHSTKDILYKNDALFVLYNKEDEDDYFPILITSKDGGNYYGKWKSFQPELDELYIIEENDEWYCEREISREQLKKELEDKGFKVIFGEDY